jgi:cytochrome c2
MAAPQAPPDASGRKRLIGLSLLLVAVAVAVWVVFFPPRWWLNITKPVDLSDPEATGAALVAEYDCRRCHLIDSQGKSKGPNLAGVTERLDAVSLRLWLRDPSAVKGRTSMPNFHLSDSEIEALVAYLMATDATKE